MAAELLQAYPNRLEALTLIPSSGGRFEVTLDGKLVYSKQQSGRHAEPGEVMRLMNPVLT